MELAKCISIDGDAVKTQNVNEEQSFSEFISCFFPNIIVTPSSNLTKNAYWILLDETYVCDADNLSIHAIEWQSIITIQYALQHQYFQFLLEIVKSYGVLINETNCALILFSIFTWLKQAIDKMGLERKKSKEYDKNVILFSKQYPSYCRNVYALSCAYNEIYKKSVNDELYDVNNVFGKRRDMQKLTINL